MKPQTKKEWMLYFNDFLLKRGIISEAEHTTMSAKIHGIK